MFDIYALDILKYNVRIPGKKTHKKIGIFSYTFLLYMVSSLVSSELKTDLLQSELHGRRNSIRPSFSYRMTTCVLVRWILNTINP